MSWHRGWKRGPQRLEKEETAPMVPRTLAVAPAAAERWPVKVPPRRHGQQCALCCGTLCCVVLCVLGALLALAWKYILGAPVVVHGTEFTFWNYGLAMWQYLLACNRGIAAEAAWYRGLSRDDPLVGEGPGPNTRTYYGWHDVRRLLEDFGPRMRGDTMHRGQEFGILLLAPDMWPETGRVMLGLANSDHAAVRPYFAAALDGARAPALSGALGGTLGGAAGRGEREECDGSRCWSASWLLRFFADRFRRLDHFSSDDLRWLLTILLHKVHLDIDLTDLAAKEFAAFQRTLQDVMPFRQNFLVELILGRYPLEPREGYMQAYKDAIRRKWPDEAWDESPEKLVVLASSMLDSLALVGGTTLPMALEYMLALLHMEGEPGRTLRPLDLTSDATLYDFIWETLRCYPPIAGVPRWVTDDLGRTWRRQVPNVGQALHDPEVFPDPLAFRLGRAGLNHADSRLSIGFAEFATVGGDAANPDSHACPGKRLALEACAAFLRAFADAGPWRADRPAAIRLNGFGSSGFTLRRAS